MKRNVTALTGFIILIVTLCLLLVRGNGKLIMFCLSSTLMNNLILEELTTDTTFETTSYPVTTEDEIYVDELDDEDPLNIDRFKTFFAR